MRRLLTVFSTCLWACGDNLAPPPDAVVGATPFEPAPHIPMPLVFPHAGVVLSSVELVTITFEGHAVRAELESFGDVVVGSSWFRAAGAEYGVHAGAHLHKHRQPGPLPASLTRDDIRARIVQLIADGFIPAPPAEHNQRLYLFHVPPSVTFSDPDVPPRPGGNRSYHEMVRLGSGVRFPIAVVLDEGKGLDAATLAAGRQLIQAATDPYEPPFDGYYADPPETDPWSLVTGGVADLCEGEDPVKEHGIALPRVYSNEAAVAGNSPCKPFVPDDVWSDVTPRPSRMQQVSPGTEVRFELTGWSTRELPDWHLRTHVADRSDFTIAEMQPWLSDDQINNKTKVTLTLTVPSSAPVGAVGGVYILSGDNGRPWAVGFIVQ